MLDIGTIDRIATKAAAAALKRNGIARVSVAPKVAWDGADALEVTIVLRGKGDAVSGEEVVDAMVSIGVDLEQAGEDRFPFVTFTTEAEELEFSGDPES